MRHRSPRNSGLDQIPFLGSHANSADPVQTPQNAASELGQHCVLSGISEQTTIKLQHPPGTPKSRNRFIQMIRVN